VARYIGVCFFSFAKALHRAIGSLRLGLPLLLRVLRIIIILTDTGRIGIRIDCTSSRVIIPILVVISASLRGLISPLCILILAPVPAGIAIRVLVVGRLSNRLSAEGPMGGVVTSRIATGILAKDVFRAFVQLWAADSGGNAVVGGSEDFGGWNGSRMAGTSTHVGTCVVAGKVHGDSAGNRGSDVVALFGDFVKLVFGRTRSTWSELAKGGEFGLGTHGDAAAAVTSVQAAENEGNDETENGKTSETAKDTSCD
jgi:hypothetical protein